MPVRPLSVLILATCTGVAAQQNSTEFFESKIRPLLANKCYSCHTASKLGDLRLDSRDAILKGGKSGAAITPGQPEESLLIRAVTYADQRLKMPLAGGKLAPQEIADLREWVKNGAPWPEQKQVNEGPKAGFHITAEQRSFWSFQPLRKPAVPIRTTEWAKTPIDRFILAALERQHLKPVSRADKRTLLRRASYDLIGLPPTPEQVEAFISDSSPDAFAKVVDRLLASPQYGERWGRHWLDVARYADGGGRDKRPVFIGYGMARDGYLNTFRYRDWVIDALNRDLPYDQFVKTQIAADLIGDEANLPALGFFGLGPWFTGDDVVFVEARANERDDRIDALTKGFLGLTVTCARCHDHKYDPISQKDYYSLGGVFWSSGYYEYDLAGKDEVDRYKAHWKKIKDQQAAIENYATECSTAVINSLASQTATYMMAARTVLTSNPRLEAAKVADQQKLDAETFVRWVKYLAATGTRQHPYLRDWDRLIAADGGTEDEAWRLAKDFQELVVRVIADKKAVLKANEEMTRTYLPDPNEARVQLPGDLMQFELFQYKQMLVQKVMETNKHYVWLEIVQGEPSSPDYPRKDAIFDYQGKKLLRFLGQDQKTRLDSMQAELAKLEKTSPPEYPYLMGLADNSTPTNLKLNVRGNPHALGDEVQRGFPAILAGTDRDPKPFTKGSGRLELAEAIVRHPLAARVIANRVWLNHFGRGIVGSPSNFGVMGERPTHPELLDYLASRLIENKWSLKSLHREIMLSAVYQLSSEIAEPNQSADPENKLLWRANLQRLDAESLRDSLLFVAGTLDERLGGPPQNLNDSNNKKRTVYARIPRNGPAGVLGLFDFPDPTISGDQRSVTNVPLQGLFLLNSDLVSTQAARLAERVNAGTTNDRDRIVNAYRLLFGRPASDSEIQRGLRFLDAARADATDKATAWQQYAQVLLTSGEFLYYN